MHRNVGFGLALGALALAAGCMDGGDPGPVAKLDTSALDAYMGDAKAPQFETPVAFHSETSQTEEIPVVAAHKGFFGRWEAKIDMKEAMEKEKAKRKADPNYDPNAESESQMGEAMASAMAEMMSFDLTINEDKTFTLIMMFFPLDGHWTQKGDRVFLKPEKVMGMSAEDFAKQGGGDAKMSSEPLELKVSPDGNSLVAIDKEGGFNDGELVFKRKAA